MRLNGKLPTTDVSIPFKREGTCKPTGDLYRKNSVEFQFPSNGKARVNDFELIQSILKTMFQFPSNGKARVNSARETYSGYAVRFQFPSNGKARVNCESKTRMSARFDVSIPFKREGTCKPCRDPLLSS